MPPFGIGAALALLAGVALSLWLPERLSWSLVALAIVLGATVWWSGRRWRWIGVLVFGFGLAGLHAAHALSVQLPVALEKGDFTVSGRIVNLPEHELRRTRFEFRIDRDEAVPAPLRGAAVRLAWYDGYDKESRRHPGPRSSLKAGQRWRMTVRLRAPRGLRNPGGFDSERYALARRISAGGYVRAPELAEQLTPARGLNAWREAMSGRIAATVPAPSSRFVRALALGDTRALDDADWELLRANGLTHLIAISGFHVGLVAGFAALLASGFWWSWPALGRACPRPVAAAIAGLAGAMLYAAVAGFALPTVRTVLMIAVVAATRWQRRPLRIADALALAAIAVLLVDPLSALMPGFWLSFAGVAWLVWCLPDSQRRPLREFLSAQGVATLGLLPLTVILFGQASLAGPFANLVAVPWWSLVVVPLSLIGTALESVQGGWGGWWWRASAWCFDLSWPLFEALGDTGLAVWWLPESRWFALPLALLGAFWVLLPRGLPGRPLALLLWLPLLWPDRGLPAHGEAELVVIDVGQGLSALVRTSNHTLLYDMGPAVRDGFDAGERAVVPVLHALGVRRLDRAVVSHGDNDHAGGYEAVGRGFQMRAVFAPEGSGVVDGAVDARSCLAGETWNWDGVEFRFLHPPRHFPYLGNEASCVLRIASHHGAALLTGDIGEVIERDLVHRHRDELRADVVLVAHHGSRGSSDPAFIQATGARHALVASGHGNRFGHPKPEVLERWREAGAATSDTASGGALRVQLRADGVRVETRRASHPRLWDAQARWDKPNRERAPRERAPRERAP
ncbi:MAG: DNA internalization-related competence protein ComEC/Rec2 [Pseudomonadota bacterium]|nr:DNA internalization-related competence protein ComEC/Rec2 [Pseudomonadota bacterium]